MRSIKGSCHCGNIRYEFIRPDTDSGIPVRGCGCSFCVKHGGVYTSHPDGRLLGHIEDQSYVNPYAFGTKTAEFHVCSVCGAVPFITSTIDSRQFAVVNVNTFENVDRNEFITSVSDFDSESIEVRLERRQRTWIPEVEIRYGTS